MSSTSLRRRSGLLQRIGHSHDGSGSSRHASEEGYSPATERYSESEDTDEDGLPDRNLSDAGEYPSEERVPELAAELEVGNDQGQADEDDDGARTPTTLPRGRRMPSWVSSNSSTNSIVDGLEEPSRSFSDVPRSRDMSRDSVEEDKRRSKRRAWYEFDTAVLIALVSPVGNWLTGGGDYVKNGLLLLLLLFYLHQIIEGKSMNPGYNIPRR
jgi:hypothetical protein